MLTLPNLTSCKQTQTQTQNDPKNNEKGKNQNTDLISCDRCEYQCKRETTLNKRKNLKHEEQVSKVSGHKSPKMLDMLKHVADIHSKENVQASVIKNKIILKNTRNTFLSLTKFTLESVNVLSAKK